MQILTPPVAVGGAWDSALLTSPWAMQRWWYITVFNEQHGCENYEDTQEFKLFGPSDGEKGTSGGQNDYYNLMNP